nr:PTS transporter subunit EIIB [Cellulosilyticum ruminicola]
MDNCVTRLRLEIKDQSLVNEKLLKSAGAVGVMRPGKTSLQVVCDSFRT